MRSLLRPDAPAVAGTPAPPLRIVLMIDGFGRGGAETVVAAQAIRLAELGHEVFVVVLQERKGEGPAARTRAAGVTLLYLPVTRLKRLDQIRALRARLRQIRPDVVHAHLEFSCILASIFARLDDVPTLVTLHTLQRPDGISRLSARLRLMNQVIGRFADRIICLTPAAHEIISADLPRRAQVAVLPNGIDLEPFDLPVDREAVRRTLGVFDDKAPLVLTVAVLRPPKGIDRLVAAAPAILDAVPNARFVIVGDGADRAALDAKIQAEGLAGRVSLAGFRSDVPEVMRAADLFVLPTLDDAMPTVLVEAMAARLPIVASAVGGIPDMIVNERDGLLVPPGDVGALSGAITRLLREPVLARSLAAGGRCRAEAEFGLDGQVARLCSLYGEVIAARGER